MAMLNDVAEAADDVPADTDVAWTGRTMKAPWFAEHMREELVLHGWDITGDDAAAQARLAQPWMTTHSVLAVGKPLLVKGVKQLRPGERIEARLRVAGVDDVAVQCGRRQHHDSSLPIRTARRRWKPMPRQGFCCCGAAVPPTRRESAVASVRPRWAGCARCCPATELGEPGRALNVQRHVRRETTAGRPARCPA